MKPRLERSPVGLRAEKFGDFIFFRSRVVKDWGQNLRISDYFGWSHATPCKCTSTSEVIAELHEWMDTFQTNPKAICAGMAFHNPHDMQAFYRMHTVKRIPTRTHTPWPNRAEMGYDCSRNFSWHSWTQLQRIWTRPRRSLLPSLCARRPHENVQTTSSGKTPMELAMGRRPRELLDPASMNPEQLTSTPTKQDLLNEDLQKLAMTTHLQDQFSRRFRQILLNGWNFFFPIFEQEKMCFVNKKIAKSSKDGSLANGWKWKSFQSKDPWQLLVLAPLSFNQISANWGDKRPQILWISKNFQTRVSKQEHLVVWLLQEMFSQTSFLSAILDLARPVELRKKEAENFTTAGLLLQVKKNNFKRLIDNFFCLRKVIIMRIRPRQHALTVTFWTLPTCCTMEGWSGRQSPHISPENERGDETSSWGLVDPLINLVDLQLLHQQVEREQEQWINRVNDPVRDHRYEILYLFTFQWVLPSGEPSDSAFGQSGYRWRSGTTEPQEWQINFAAE